MTARSQGKTRVVFLRLNPDEMEDLEALMRLRRLQEPDRSITISEVVREAIHAQRVAHRG